MAFGLAFACNHTGAAHHARKVAHGFSLVVKQAVGIELLLAPIHQQIGQRRGLIAQKEYMTKAIGGMRPLIVAIDEPHLPPMRRGAAMNAVDCVAHD